LKEQAAVQQSAQQQGQSEELREQAAMQQFAQQQGQSEELREQAAVQQFAQQQGQPEELEEQAAVQQSAQQQGQSVMAPTTNSFYLDNIFRVATSVQYIMTEINGTMSEKEKTLVIT
jgi:hypothetical protein